MDVELEGLRARAEKLRIGTILFLSYRLGPLLIGVYSLRMEIGRL